VQRAHQATRGAISTRPKQSLLGKIPTTGCSFVGSSRQRIKVARLPVIVSVFRVGDFIRRRPSREKRYYRSDASLLSRTVLQHFPPILVRHAHHTHNTRLYGFKNSLNVAVTIAFASTGVRSWSRDEAEDIAMCAATVNSAAFCRSSACSILVSMVVRTALRAGAVSCVVSFGRAICFPSKLRWLRSVSSGVVGAAGND
jgi:hypothetical protein